MFTVINKDNKEICNIYDIAYDKNGYPHFLIYKDEQWVRMSAKHFAPVSGNETIVDALGVNYED